MKNYDPNGNKVKKQLEFSAERAWSQGHLKGFHCVCMPNTYMYEKYYSSYSKLIGSKNDNIQVLPSEIQEFPSTG